VLEKDLRSSRLRLSDGGGVHHDSYRLEPVGGEIPCLRE